ncbi:MAG: hypothetical protein HYZ57_06150 [Acidobacteria bacterium]|nr:hypothetical protein [Acidobacteriota bacterium]
MIGETAEGAGLLDGGADGLVGEFGLEGHFPGDEDVLGSDDAEQAPVGKREVVDHGALEGVGGGEALEVAVEQCLKAKLGFTGQENGLGGEAVAEAVGGGPLFARGRDRPSGFGAVLAGSFRSSHESLSGDPRMARVVWRSAKSGWENGAAERVFVDDSVGVKNYFRLLLKFVNAPRRSAFRQRSATARERPCSFTPLLGRAPIGG